MLCHRLIHAFLPTTHFSSSGPSPAPAGLPPHFPTARRPPPSCHVKLLTAVLLWAADCLVSPLKLTPGNISASLNPHARAYLTRNTPPWFPDRVAIQMSTVDATAFARPAAVPASPLFQVLDASPTYPAANAHH